MAPPCAGEELTRYLIELAFLEQGSKWLDMGAADGSTVRLLRSLGYSAQGIHPEPRGKDTARGNYLECPWQEGFFDGIISQCSFYAGGNVPGALKEASRMLRRGGKLVFSDVTEDVVSLLKQCRELHFAVRHLEDLTDEWKERGPEDPEAQEHICLPQEKELSYVLFVCEKMI